MKFVAGDPKMGEDVRMLALRAFPDDYSGSKQKTPVSEHHWKQWVS